MLLMQLKIITRTIIHLIWLSINEFKDNSLSLLQISNLSDLLDQSAKVTIVTRRFRGLVVQQTQPAPLLGLRRRIHFGSHEFGVLWCGLHIRHLPIEGGRPVVPQSGPDVCPVVLQWTEIPVPGTQSWWCSTSSKHGLIPIWKGRKIVCSNLPVSMCIYTNHKLIGHSKQWDVTLLHCWEQSHMIVNNINNTTTSNQSDDFSDVSV